MILVDSRERVGLFRSVWLKPNQRECKQATGWDDAHAGAQELANRCGGPVFCTMGENGIAVADPRGQACVTLAPGYPVTGPIDPVGAGDSTSAGIAVAHAAGASLTEAAAFGNLVASITIQQIGVTGCATPDQVRARWREICRLRRSGT
jgi:sugar/nucleoside kinase (ribokinase family)